MTTEPAIAALPEGVREGNERLICLTSAAGAKVNGGLRHSSNVADDLAAKREAKAAEVTPSS